MATDIKTLNGLATASVKTILGQNMKGNELTTTSWGSHANLKAYYRFESGALTTDASGNGRTLTAISDPAETTGKFGGGVDFDGNDAYSIADHSTLKPTGAFTVGAWVKTNTSSGTKYIFWSGAHTSVPIKRYGIGIAVQNATGYVFFQSKKGTGDVSGTDFAQAIGTTSILGTTWRFVVCTQDATSINIYIDGQLDATASWAFYPAYTTNYVRIGCSNQDGATNANFMTGQMDDLFLLNGTALTATEILALYKAYKTKNGASL